MRAVVGSILLLLAVCLVSLGVYFWTAPRAQPTEMPVIAAKVTTAQPADAPTVQPSGSEAYPTPNASPPIPEAKAREAVQLERAARELERAARQVPEDEVTFRKMAKLDEAARQVPKDEVSFRKLAKLDEAARLAAEEEQRRYEVIRRDLDALHRQTELDRRDADAKREPPTSADAIKGIVVTLSGVATGLIGWLVLYSDRRKKKEATSIPS